MATRRLVKQSRSIEVTSRRLDSARPGAHRLNRSRVRSRLRPCPEERGERDRAMSVLTDHPPYPISAAAARQLERPLFGHVIDGEVVPSRDGATMPVRRPRDRRAGRHRGRRLRGRRRARRALRARGVRRRPLALPRAARAGAAAAPARRADRRARRRARRARRHRLGPAAALRRLHRPVRGRRHRLLLRLADEAARAAIPAAPREFAVYQVREPIGVVGAIVPWNGPTAAAAMALVRARRRQQRRAQAGRADADDRGPGRRAGARGRDPRGRVQRRPGHRRDRRRRARRPPGGRRDHVHRLGRDRPRDPGRAPPRGSSA